jgi:hypothetical protein
MIKLPINFVYNSWEIKVAPLTTDWAIQIRTIGNFTQTLTLDIEGAQKTKGALHEIHHFSNLNFLKLSLMDGVLLHY